jgi:hypothetical protein
VKGCSKLSCRFGSHCELALPAQAHLQSFDLFLLIRTVDRSVLVAFRRDLSLLLSLRKSDPQKLASPQLHATFHRQTEWCDLYSSLLLL